MNEMNSLR